MFINHTWIISSLLKSSGASHCFSSETHGLAFPCRRVPAALSHRAVSPSLPPGLSPALALQPISPASASLSSMLLWPECSFLTSLMDQLSFVIISSCLFGFGLHPLHSKHQKVKEHVSHVLCFIIRIYHNIWLVDATQKSVKQKNINEGAEVQRGHFLELSQNINSRPGPSTQFPEKSWFPRVVGTFSNNAYHWHLYRSWHLCF